MTKEDINSRALEAIEWLLSNTDKLTKTALAESFSVKPAKFTEILKGRMYVGADMLAALCKTYGFSSEWLLTGTGSMFEIQDLQQPTEAEKKLIPFFDDITTIGGHNDSTSIMEISQNHVSEWIDAGDWFPDATAAIRHYGDSMIEYPSGSILALKRVHDKRLIINGRNYVIETTEFRVTKQLQDDGGDYIIAYSSNRETYPDGRQIHSPIRIPKDTIRSIDLVLGCVLKEYSNGALTIRK